MKKLIDDELHTAESILEKYTPLVHKHAAKLCAGDYHFKEDLIQVGYIGLLNAFKKFDASSEIKFISFAYKYVRGYMRNLHRERGLIHVPPKIKTAAWKIDRQGLWDLPDEEIAKLLEVNLRTIEGCRIYFSFKDVASADAEKDGKDNLYNFVGYEHDLSHPSVTYYMELLNQRERVILLMLMDGDSYAEIGKEIEISKQRVGQIFKKIKEKVELQILKENR